MLVTFVSDAHENITMFGDIAVTLLKMMGHSGTIPGAFIAEEVPEALEKLKEGVLHQKSTFPIDDIPSSDEEDMEVSLANRAWPLIELFEAASKKKCNVLWSKNN